MIRAASNLCDELWRPRGAHGLHPLDVQRCARQRDLVHRFHGTDHLCGIHVSCHGLYPDLWLADGVEAMTAWRQAFEMTVADDALAKLVSIARSRTGPSSRSSAARRVLAYPADASVVARGQG